MPTHLLGRAGYTETFRVHYYRAYGSGYEEQPGHSCRSWTVLGLGVDRLDCVQWQSVVETMTSEATANQGTAFLVLYCQRLTGPQFGRCIEHRLA